MLQIPKKRKQELVDLVMQDVYGADYSDIELAVARALQLGYSEGQQDSQKRLNIGINTGSITIS